MGQRSLFFLVSLALMLQVTACGSASTPLPAGTENPSNPISSPMPSSLVPILTANPTQLTASARLGAFLTGSGRVERSLLTFNDLMSGRSTAPVDDHAFALPEEAAMPGVVFEGSLQISAGLDNGSRVIRDDLYYSADPARLQLPPFDLQFVQDGSYLISVSQ